jgi:hypothetical protein
MRTTSLAFTAVALSVALGGCSESRFLNSMGMGKTAPDESQVTRNQQLSMPPDLQLPAPSNAPEPAPQVAAAPASPPPLPDTIASSGTQVAAGEPAAGQLSTNPDQPVDNIQTASIDPKATSNASVQTGQKTDLSGETHKQDAYVKYGISKTKPDGTAKSQVELDKELLEAIRVEKRKGNPSYGTVFNIRNIFTGN